jgi:ferrous iron transport protein A
LEESRPVVQNASTPLVGALIPLGRGRKGFKGVVVQVGAVAVAHGRSTLEPAELERRLLEIGFVEGARVEILHVGLLGGDPLAIRLDDMRVALRRREADAVLVRADAPDR